LTSHSSFVYFQIFNSLDDGWVAALGLGLITSVFAYLAGALLRADIPVQEAEAREPENRRRDALRQQRAQAQQIAEEKKLERDEKAAGRECEKIERLEEELYKLKSEYKLWTSKMKVVPIKPDHVAASKEVDYLFELKGLLHSGSTINIVDFMSKFRLFQFSDLLKVVDALQMELGNTFHISPLGDMRIYNEEGKYE
jgi:hypothetical protein